MRQGNPRGVEVVLPATTSSALIEVHLTGAVAQPGVYSFQEGARLEDAIAAAGGTTGDADLARLNLALRLQDEYRFHVPRVGETAVSLVEGPGGRESTRLNLNGATLEELQALPGIGQVKANAILAYREAQGGFQSVEELLKVSGIGPATFEGIWALVAVE